MNLEFTLEPQVTFHVEELDVRLQRVHDLALLRAKRYLRLLPTTKTPYPKPRGQKSARTHPGMGPQLTKSICETVANARQEIPMGPNAGVQSGCTITT